MTVEELAKKLMELPKDERKKTVGYFLGDDGDWEEITEITPYWGDDPPTRMVVQ